MARCNDCGKFVGNEQGEPEITGDPEILMNSPTTAEVTAEVRITLNCAECGTELSGFDLSMEGEVTLPPGFSTTNNESDFELEASDPENTERTEGKGMKPKKFYGADLQVTVTHKDFPDWKRVLALHEDVQASAMDDSQ